MLWHFHSIIVNTFLSLFLLCSKNCHLGTVLLLIVVSLYYSNVELFVSWASCDYVSLVVSVSDVKWFWVNSSKRSRKTRPVWSLLRWLTSWSSTVRCLMSPNSVSIICNGVVEPIGITCHVHSPIHYIALHLADADTFLESDVKLFYRALLPWKEERIAKAGY